MTSRLANPWALQWLWLLPAFFVLSWWGFRRQAQVLKKVIDAKLLPFLTQTLSNRKKKIKVVLELLTLFFFILAMSRPQTGQTREKVKSEGIELMLLVDVSQSMLAEDVRPSRLELIKRELLRLLQMSTGDRIGLIAFAGSAVLLSPMTTDRDALKMYIESLSPQSVSEQGTEFRKALAEAEQAFQRGGVEGGKDSVTTRAIIIASDGEDQEPGALDAAKKLADQGVRIFTLALGTEKGGPIPVRDERGNLQSYLKDSSGQVVLTQTKGSILKDLAERGRGSFRQVTFGGSAMQELREDIAQLQRSVFDSAEIINYNERFQWLVVLGLVLGLLELLLGDRKRPGTLWRGRFEVPR